MSVEYQLHGMLIGIMGEKEFHGPTNLERLGYHKLNAISLPPGLFKLVIILTSTVTLQSFVGSSFSHGSSHRVSVE